jgi:hypothetical protein
MWWVQAAVALAALRSLPRRLHRVTSRHSVMLARAASRSPPRCPRRLPVSHGDHHRGHPSSPLSLAPRRPRHLPAPHGGHHRGHPSSPLSPTPRPPPIEAVLAFMVALIEVVPASVAATHRGCPHLHIRCPSRTPLERGAGRRPGRGRAGRPGTTTQRPQARSGGHGAWRCGTRRMIGFRPSDGAHGCSTTDIMASNRSRTEQGGCWS